MIHLALYQPDIPQNLGAAMRLCACLGVVLDIIEPCGFPLDEGKIRRAGMDYIDLVDFRRHESWDKFQATYTDRRLILMTTKTKNSYCDFTFMDGDILIAGRESAGVPETVHNIVHDKITIPMHGKARSINVINASAMVLGESLRQLKSD